MSQADEISTVDLNDQRNSASDVDILPKLATEAAKEDGNPPVIEHTRGDSPSTGQDHTSDIASVNSVPVGHAADSPVSNGQRQTTGNNPTAPATRLPPPSPLRSSTLQEDGQLSLQQRRARHRSAIEPRSSNRLSGFFSNLIHRREPLSSSSRDPIREDSVTPDPLNGSENASRSSSPVPPRAPSPPPPSLPPPTLIELGLSLLPLTSELSPSHFTTPPSSGAFLAPHYLLLCHAQGLDVIPLVSPPAPQPYALIRRVSFKSVVVMEQRGVLVAIAGRRDGVRVYALEEVKRAIEWRIEVEVKRERDRTRREAVKKMALRTLDNSDRDSAEKARKSLSTPPPDSGRIPANLIRKSSQNNLPSPSAPPVPLVPRSATPRAPKKKAKTHPTEPNTPGAEPSPSGHPPPYASSAEIVTPVLQSRPSHISLRSRSRGASISNVITVAPVPRTAGTSRHRDRDNEDSKADWAESSDEDAIDVVAAGPSGSHLDERTSAANQNPSPVRAPPVGHTLPVPVPARTVPGSLRRNRPTDLDLSLTRSPTIPPPEPSPAPTLHTLRQALSHSPVSMRGESTEAEAQANEPDEDEEDVDGHISLAQALLESRIPDLPPLGTRRPQEPIFITPTAAGRAQELPTAPHSAHASSLSRASTSNNSTTTARRRRRWSIMITSPSPDTASVASTPNVSTTPTTPLNRFSRSHSFRSTSQPLSARSATELSTSSPTTALPPVPDSATLPPPPPSSRSSRFIPRIISNAFQGRRSDERPSTTVASPIDSTETNRWAPSSQASPPPKLEYVKLPGTKGALLIKAVETARKSFLAILCGEHGEKVELFAGTYRTALGLSRTFILPDSPRSLELQLQGDDLVEVFLVFAQNVFGLEPATVRVREVRIGRAERRAARRRAREHRLGDAAPNDTEALEEETNVNVSIGVSVPVISGNATAENDDEGAATPTLIANEHPGLQADPPSTPNETTPPNPSIAPSEELMLLATAQMGPYTTFQQLTFAPNFPLASIADEYIIPPTYPTFMEYKTEHEPENSGEENGSATQFSPPGLPVPAPAAPTKWYYRDPKNVVHGPWKASLMQAWFKDGLLPLDLPVRREDDTEYILLKDLRLQCVDPTQPFKAASTPTSSAAVSLKQTESLPLLSPISLLSQPKHFGPPALFFSSRGGHSTSIVDARGRSVLKGRFFWTNDEEKSTGKMGDIKRLEAFDVNDRSVLVAMRQGGLEVVDLGDALLKPADESRTILPHYNPPTNNTNRRKPYVWRIGTPLLTSSNNSESLTIKGKSSNMSTQGRKSSLGPNRGSNGKNDFISNDVDVYSQDEVLFLGRKEDEVYFCERNATSFRILRLSPTDESS